MPFSIQFDTGNAAFEPDPAQECIWAIQQVAQALRAGRVEGGVMDSNGNKIGKWELVAERD